MFVTAGAVLVSAWRKERMPLFLFVQVLVLAAFAAWLGFGYRIVTAGVIGANIGGGGVLLITPVIALGSVAVVVGLGILGSRQARRARESA